MKKEDLNKIVSEIPENSDIQITFASDENLGALRDLLMEREEEKNCLSKYSLIFYKGKARLENKKALWNNTLIIFDKNVSSSS